MLLIRLIIVSLFLVSANSLTCYDCTAPDNYFCFPFIICEVTMTECTPDVIYNAEIFMDSPPVEYRYYINI